MLTSAKAVGIYNGEIYISDDGKKVSQFSVIRPVSAELLNELHTIQFWMDNYRYWWVDAAKAGTTDLSLEDWFTNLMDEDDDGEEEFIGKDGSDCHIFDLYDGLRERCDRFIKKSRGVDVGTWECAGSYCPRDWSTNAPKKFDLVLDEELAGEYYKLNGLK